MGLFRNKHEDSNEAGSIGVMEKRDGTDRRSSVATVERYMMQQEMLSMGDDYWIETQTGEKTLKVNGKAARARDTFLLEDRHGNEVLKIQERAASLRDTMKIERTDGGDAIVHKAAVGVRDRFIVSVTGEPDIHAQGNIVGRSYNISQDGHTIGRVSKEWFKFRDTYGVEVEAGADTALVLAITVCLDSMSRW